MHPILARRALANAAAAIVTLSLATAPGVAAPVLNADNGHYYDLVVHGDLTWQQAKLLAENSSHAGMPGHLVAVNSAGENEFLRTNYAALIGDTDAGVPGLYAWIGLTDEVTEGSWKWVTGEPFSYTNWSPGEPNDFNARNEDYAHYWVRNGNFSWNDQPEVNAGRVTASIFEYQAVPEPSSLALVAVAGLACFRRRRPA